MFEVIHTNFGTIFGERFDTIDAAAEFAASKGFEATIFAREGLDALIVASWSPIGGTRRYGKFR